MGRRGENLVKYQWPKGRSGNPHGPKPGQRPSLTEAIIRQLDEHPDLVDKLARRILAQVARGDAATLKLVWERLEGLVGKQRGELPALVVEVEGETQEPRAIEDAPAPSSTAVVEVEATPIEVDVEDEVDEGEDEE